MREPVVGDGGQRVWQQHRKNPPPVVREAQGNGIYLLAHGEPHDPCPVAGCEEPTLPAPVRAIVSGLPICNHYKHGRPSPWGRDDTWWRQRAQQISYTGTVGYRRPDADCRREVGI